MIALVQHVPAADNVGSVNGSVTIAAATAGNLLVAAAGFPVVQASAVTNPVGYTRRSSQDQSANKCGLIVEKVAAGGETSITFTHASTQWNIEAFEFSGCGVSGSEFDAQSSAAIASATTAKLSAPFTPGGTSEVIVICIGQGNDNGGSEAVDSGFTILDTGSFTKFMVAYKIKTDAAAEDPQFSWLTARTGGMCLAAFKPYQKSLVAASSVRRRPLMRTR
jgi:hypothetical protein